MFPLLKRATAIGICNFVSRFFTIFAPLAAELEKPLPLLCLLIFNMTALLISLTFPSRQSEIDRHAQILADAAEAQNDFKSSIQSKRAMSDKHRSGIFGDGLDADFKPFVNDNSDIKEKEGDDDKDKDD